MAIVQLKGEVRTKTGKGAARSTRREGLVPGVLYGKGEESVVIKVNRKDLVSVIQGGAGSNVIIDLKLAGLESTDTKALIRDLQRDPITGGITHLDLQHISMTEKINVEVPIHVVGTAIGVKDFGGILEYVMRQVPVECLPTDIPNAITVDISALMVHDSIHVGDIQLENAVIELDPGQVILTIVAPTVEKEATPEEAAAAAAEPEVIGKKKEEGAEDKDDKKDDKKKDKK